MEYKYLKPKYLVSRIKEGGPAGTGVPPTVKSTDPDNIDSPFVLMPRKDPAALLAMLFYAEVCDTNLSAEIRTWLRKIAEAPPQLGSQGVRNYIAMRIKQLEST